MLIFVLPVYNCYNELAAGLPAFTGLLHARGEACKVIVVDDGSANGAAIEALSAQYGCSYIRNEMNRGKGYSVKKGFESAGGDYYIFMDGDFPFDLSVVVQVIDSLRTAGTDLVIGDRTLPASSFPSDLPRLRKTGSAFLSALLGRFVTPGHFDTQCGIKGFTKRSATAVFGQLRQQRFCFDVEILFIAIRRKLTIRTIPVTVKKQEGSTVRIVHDGIDMIKGILEIYCNKLAGRYSFT